MAGGLRGHGARGDPDDAGDDGVGGGTQDDSAGNDGDNVGAVIVGVELEPKQRSPKSTGTQRGRTIKCGLSD